MTGISKCFGVAGRWMKVGGSESQPNCVGSGALSGPRECFDFRCLVVESIHLLMSENMVLNTLQNLILRCFFYRFKPQINFDTDFFFSRYNHFNLSILMSIRTIWKIGTENLTGPGLELETSGLPYHLNYPALRRWSSREHWYHSPEVSGSSPGPVKFSLAIFQIVWKFLVISSLLCLILWF